jgi:hypothetical protein
MLDPRGSRSTTSLLRAGRRGWAGGAYGWGRPPAACFSRAGPDCQVVASGAQDVAKRVFLGRLLSCSLMGGTNQLLAKAAAASSSPGTRCVLPGGARVVTLRLLGGWTEGPHRRARWASGD